MRLYLYIFCHLMLNAGKVLHGLEKLAAVHKDPGRISRSSVEDTSDSG